MDNIGTTIVSISAAIIGLAALAVIFSKNSNTTSVVSSGGSALSSVIKAAVSPVSGVSTSQ